MKALGDLIELTLLSDRRLAETSNNRRICRIQKTIGENVESIVLTDCKRYDAMGIDLLFYDDDDGTRHWVFKPSCAYKFIVAHGVLLIGPIRTHVYLLIAAATLMDSVEDAKVKKTAMERQWHSGVTAAGEVGIDGVVTGWKSGGFNVETSEDQRPEIAEAIRCLYEAGELIIQ